MFQTNLLTPTRGYPHTSLSAANFDVRPALSKLTAPVLVVHGERDLVNPLSARAWTAAMPNARLLLIPGVGHFPHVDAPDIFFPAVDSFLRANAPSAKSAYDRLYQEISARSRGLAEALSRHNWPKAASMYDERASIFAPGAPPVIGRRLIESFWRAAYDKGLRRVHHFTVEVERDGDTVVEVGKYVVNGEENRLLDVGKYLIVWKRNAQGWSINRDVYNSSAEQRSPLERADYLPEPLGSWIPDR